MVDLPMLYLLPYVGDIGTIGKTLNGIGLPMCPFHVQSCPLYPKTADFVFMQPFFPAQLIQILTDDYF